MTDYEQAYRDLRAGVEALADEWDGYGHGVYCTHLEDQLPCGTCTVLARIRALLASSAPATASDGAAEPIHDDDCDSRGCTHCEVCGAGVRYGSRCSAHPMPGSSGAVALAAATGVTSSDGDRGLSEPLVDLWRDVAKSGITDGVDYPGIVLALIAERAARTAQPEGVERVEWETRSEWQGCRCGHPGAGCYCSSVTVRTGRRRTVTEYAPVVGPWEVVGDE